MKRLLKEKLKSFIPDRLYLKYEYWHIMKRRLNLKNPRYYTEKLQWLKLYDRNIIYTKLVDKYLVKEYIENIVGEKYVIPTLAIWNNIEEIDINSLPEKFVIKCTHDSGGVIVVTSKDELNESVIKNIIGEHLKYNYYYNAREWPYKNVKPRILIEQYLDESGSKALGILNDYKFFCFNGKIDSIMVCLERNRRKHPIYVFYSVKWERLYYQKDEPVLEAEVDIPINFNEMIEIVQKLCFGFKCIRVDLYNVNGKVYFGEYTFFNQAGFDLDITEETDMYWGSLINLPKG